MDAFWAAPPVTRTLTALTFIQSVLLLCEVLSPYYVVFMPHFIFKFPPEIWRLFSSFLVAGRKWQFFYNLYHMFKYGSAVEKNTPYFAGPGDFFMYVIYVGTLIVLTAGCYFGFATFTTALILAFVYTYARANQGMKVKFFMAQLPVEVLPWAFVVVDLVVYGTPMAILGVTGIIAAHTYDFLTRIYPTFGGGKNYLTTPAFVRRYFSRFTPRGVHRSYGTSYRAPQPQESSGSSWASSLQGDWSARGRGRRLGG